MLIREITYETGIWNALQWNS